MKKQQLAGLMLGVALVVGSSMVLWAQEKAKAMPPMDPAMEQAMKNGAPSAGHKMLDPLIGHWNASIRSWMKPGDKPMESQGASEQTWVLGGRFVKQEYKGNWSGQPFEGLGFTGYDNIRQEYQSIWLDNFMTGIMTVAGTYDAQTKLLNQSGQFSCPMTGEKARWYRSELKIENNDKHTYSSYGKGPDGKEFKSMEIVYTRVK